jgi:hypothetical protein
MIAVTTLEDIDLTILGSDDAYAAEHTSLVSYVAAQVNIAQECGHLNSAFIRSESLRPKS